MAHVSKSMLGLLPLVYLLKQAQQVSSCETAFAYSSEDSSLCFLEDDDNSFDRWGWTIGPISVSSGYSSTFEMYGGAADCDFTNKGYHVGTANVSIDADGSFSIDLTSYDDWNFGELHVYIGESEYPTSNGASTVAPGQYPYKGNGMIDDFDSEGEYYIIVHSVACHDGETETDSTDSTDSSDSSSTSEAPMSCEDDWSNYYLVLSGTWLMDDPVNGYDNVDLSGSYYYDEASMAFVKSDDSSVSIGFESTSSGDYILYVGGLAYREPLGNWDNDNNPFVTVNSEDETNWDSGDETGTYYTGDMTLYDCFDEDQGDELCDEGGNSLFPAWFDCDEGGSVSLPVISQASGFGARLAIFTCMVAGVWAL